MAGLISLRVSNEERRRLQQMKEQRGVQSISEAVRLQLGFPPRQSESLDGVDDIEGVQGLSRMVLRMLDRLDDNIKLTTKIARHLGLPYPRQVRGENLEAPLPDPSKPMPREPDGHKRVSLPDGFDRGTRL